MTDSARAEVPVRHAPARMILSETSAGSRRDPHLDISLGENMYGRLLWSARVAIVGVVLNSRS